MKKVFILIYILCFFAACNNNKAAPEKADVVESKEAASESNFVSLTDVQNKVAGVELGTIELKNLKTSIKANGLLSVPNQNKAFVTSLSNGVIKTSIDSSGQLCT